jgi:hypothetical protein
MELLVHWLSGFACGFAVCIWAVILQDVLWRCRR